MRSPRFKKWFASLPALNQPQRDHQRFREWLGRFHGVASRYLPNYLGWRRALDGGRVTSALELLRLAISPIHSKG